MILEWPENLSAETFLKDYWQKKPLLIRDAFPDFENPLSPDELGGLALDEDIHSRLILQESGTKWHLRTGPFTEAELTSLPGSDWTLLVSDIEIHLDGFHRFLEFFRFVPDWRIDDLMISYAPTGASAGAHVDAYDVFLFQAAGTRQWLIDSNANTDHSFLPDIDIKILTSFNPDEDWLLKPGDMLYLPPGIAHHGISRDDNCMTWSVGFRAPTHAELLVDVAQQLVKKIVIENSYQDPNIECQDHPGEISQQSRARLREIWDELTTMDDKTFEQTLGCVLTQRTPDEIKEAVLSIDDLASGEVEVLQRNPAACLAFSRTGNSVTLFANGNSFKVTAGFAEFLTDNFQYDVQALLEEAKGKNNAACLQSLLNTTNVFMLL